MIKTQNIENQETTKNDYPIPVLPGNRAMYSDRCFWGGLFRNFGIQRLPQHIFQLVDTLVGK